MNLFQRMNAEFTRHIGKVREDIIEMTGEIKSIQQDISHIKNKLESHEGWLEHVSDNTDSLHRRLEELERHVEDQEIRNRRDNVLLHGVPEDARETPEKSEELFLESVNSVLTEPLQKSDIVRAHRIGKQGMNRTRPLMARLAKSKHKYDILQKREELRKKKIGVSGDLTVQQRQQIQDARQEGKFAYFKDGVLHVEERRSNSDSNADRRYTRSYAKTLSQPNG